MVQEAQEKKKNGASPDDIADFMTEQLRRPSLIRFDQPPGQALAPSTVSLSEGSSSRLGAGAKEYLQDLSTSEEGSVAQAALEERLKLRRKKKREAMQKHALHLNPNNPRVFGRLEERG